jgi:tellurite methyltransferase
MPMPGPALPARADEGILVAMALESWEETYRKGPLDPRAPDPLVVKIASTLPPGRALDLACGTGRNALWLAEQGWRVTAVDISPTAIASLAARAKQRRAAVDLRVADLEKDEYTIEPLHWELITACYYLQRDLFKRAKQGLVPGGILVAIALMVEPGKQHSPFRVQPGELGDFFEGWEILHHREGADAAHRAVAEIVARRPNSDTI